jgi:hypothetical protein
MIGARLTAGVALASIKLWLPFVHEAGIASTFAITIHQSNLTKSLKIS